MRLLVLFFIILLLGLGCIEERPFLQTKLEQLIDTQQTDMDNDGISDYIVYTYSPTTIDEVGMEVQRHITVSVQTTGTYTSIEPDLTDIDVGVVDQNLGEFSDSKIQAESTCSNKIGLLGMNCADVTTCSKLCSGATLKCKEIAADFDEVLANSMISYLHTNTEIRSLLVDSKRMTRNLKNATVEERNAFLQKTRAIVGKIGELNANPLYAYPLFSLCTHSDFGVSQIIGAETKLGQYETRPSSYHYTAILSVKPIEVTETEELGEEILGVVITDSISEDVLIDTEQISSIQDLAVTENMTMVDVTWNSPKPSKEGYLLSYEFTSETDPETALQGLKTPVISVKTINLSGLAPTNFAFLAIYGISKDYFVSLGIAVGLTVSALMLIYSVIILTLSMIRERAAGGTFTAGFRKAFGRTDVRWKSDLIVGVLFFGAGVIVTSFVATQPSAAPPLLESLEVLQKSDMGSLGMTLSIIGVVLAYLSAENFVKIIILERAYGMVIRQEKDMFLAKAAKLKDKIAELTKLVEECSQDEFDVSKEYDMVTSMRSERVDQIARDMTAQNKVIIEDQLIRIDNALSSLKERKRLADENWPKWKETITKILNERNEVYIASLVTVPASLRSWTFGRYIKEVGAENFIFERDVLKKKKLTASKLVQEMIRQGYLSGAIIIKEGTIETAEFESGPSTVLKVLTLKLKTYSYSLAKNLGQHQPTMLASVGAKNVVLYTKNKMMESILFMPRDKYKEAFEKWKAKSKILETS